MYDQLVEMMPELAKVLPWHTVGQRRKLCEVGTTAQRGLAEEVCVDRGDWTSAGLKCRKVAVCLLLFRL